ncbi:thiol-disulfide oxidoreductase DCC family protein [Kordia sp.]|uniref:thiol-disulfide oxidoreductase DCC family protein n=1 Tax=Kordia sp. TaxID=1965332 RepID=UPI003D2DD8EF
MTTKKLDELIEHHHIVIYDGVCGFCDASIQFILDQKPSNELRFVSFQSETGQQIMAKFNLEINLDTIILIEKGIVRQKAKAFLGILTHVESPYRFVGYFTIIPSFISNVFYDIIAKYRYKIMGKVAQCRLLTPTERAFFLE